jgi:hypothetical protein
MTHFQPKRLLSSALTCSQGIPSCGLASKSARRRSSSAACSGVRSGSHPSSMMISQKSCASLILSSCGRAFAASRISVAVMLQKDYIAAHFRLLSLSGSSAQTCSHGIPRSGLRLNRSARRSASSICSGDKPSSKSPNSSTISVVLTLERLPETHAVGKLMTVLSPKTKLVVNPRAESQRTRRGKKKRVFLRGLCASARNHQRANA